MKKAAYVLIIILISKYVFAQNDTIVLNTPAIFSITFHQNKKSLFHLNEYTTFNDVYLDILTKDFLFIRKKYSDEKKPNAISWIGKIPLKDIKSLGYSVGKQGKFGTLLGTGIGVAGGVLIAILTKIADNEEFDSKYSNGTIASFWHPLLAFGSAGAILGYIIGDNTNKYQTYELAAYDDNNKYQEISKIVQKSLNYSKKKDN